jgi:WD40 repeat protein
LISRCAWSEKAACIKHLISCNCSLARSRASIILQILSSFVCRSRRVEAELVDAMVRSPALPGKSESVSRVAHDGAIRCVTVDVAGKLVVSGGSDGKVKLWNLATRELMAALSGHEGPVRICVKRVVEQKC